MKKIFKTKEVMKINFGNLQQIGISISKFGEKSIQGQV